MALTLPANTDAPRATSIVQRREFIMLVGGAAAWPLTGRAQRSAMPVIGFLNSQSAGPFSHMVAGFHRGLSEAGLVEGRNIAIEYRWAEGQYERLPTLANELVHRVRSRARIIKGLNAALDTVDRGKIDTGERSAPLCELERGDEAVLFTVASELTRALPAKLAIKVDKRGLFFLLS